MKTKNCPFCSKEISDEAIICKYCHRLLIDENGNDILPEDEGYDDTEAAAAETEEPAFDEEKTIVYNKKDLQDLMNKSRTESVSDNDATEEFNASAVIGAASEEEDPDGEDYDDYDGDDRDNSGSDDYSDYSDYPEDDFPEDDLSRDEGGYEPEKPQPAYQRGTHRARENEYDDEELANAADYDPKRTFMVTAIVTLGILLIIIVAVLVGYKLFGFGDTQETTTSQTPVTAPTQTGAPVVDPAATIANPTESAFVPQITDDTVSENPEEIVNSSLSDPVVDSNAAAQTPPVVDSAASTPETVVPDSSSAADSQANIVIIPDPDAVNSAASTDSSTDSSADSIGDGPAADSSQENDSSREAAGSGAPGFEPAGSYYSWSEADTLMSNYAAANGLNGYEYSYGTDGVEMIYAAYNDDGSVSYYRVDLQTGVVSAY